MVTKEEKQKAKELRNINSRFKKQGFQCIKDGILNIEFIPWGYNWVLGYCEHSSNFEKR
jgi:hypothetical protein